MMENNERETLLLELAQRLASSFYSFGGTASQLYVGTVIPALQEKLPLPDKSRVFGSAQADEQTATILFDSPLSPDATLTFYREQMQAAGWQEAPSHFPIGGFAGDSPALNLQYLQGPQGPSLTLHIIRQGPPTPVRLLLDLHMRPYQPHHTDHASPLPVLLAPPGSQIRQNGSGWSDYEAHSSMTLQLPEAPTYDTPSLLEHFNEQLKQNGWHLLAAESRTYSASSLWRFQHTNGTHWRGIISLFRMPDIPLYELSLRIVSEESDPYSPFLPEQKPRTFQNFQLKR
ncbi:hypothetical protein [Thermosporothrix hazakensis]|jgi:hypothetical protein|nr:hypothetical protein [Thermosporothrix hazakensis]GCE50872.1 hypothetical protein KTH_57410 [Thermosporothrix hazakensis]